MKSQSITPGDVRRIYIRIYIYTRSENSPVNGKFNSIRGRACASGCAIALENLVSTFQSSSSIPSSRHAGEQGYIFFTLAQNEGIFQLDAEMPALAFFYSCYRRSSSVVIIALWFGLHFKRVQSFKKCSGSDLIDNYTFLFILNIYL